VLSGAGFVRDETETRAVSTEDTFVFKPGEALQITGGETEDLVVMVIADNPIGESCYYPDSKKWLVRSPETRLIRSDKVGYYDGEECPGSSVPTLPPRPQSFQRTTPVAMPPLLAA
jgi:hypothetical protein